MARTGQGEGMAGFCQGARDLCRHKNWWLLATAYGVMTGISSSWSAILSVDLAPVFFDSDADGLDEWVEIDLLREMRITVPQQGIVLIDVG